MKTLTHKIKFGIVGCGMIANVHAKAISEIAEAELVGASDNSYDYALKFAQKWGIKAFNDYNELLSDKEIDVVCVFAVCDGDAVEAEGGLFGCVYSCAVAVFFCKAGFFI